MYNFSALWLEQLNSFYSNIQSAANSPKGKVRFAKPESCLWTIQYEAILKELKDLKNLSVDIEIATNDEIIRLFKLVGIPAPESRIHNYPFEMSGGMQQRVMIAMALASHPKLLIADEPTTALDVTIQAQILDLMLHLKARRAGAAILLITHNLAVVAETCDRVAVMYGGKIQEIAPIDELFRNPLHPYTQGLLGSIPRVDGPRAARLTVIPGTVPDIHNLPVGCKFVTRCPSAFEPCPDIEPPLIEMAPGHLVRCHLYPR